MASATMPSSSLKRARMRHQWAEHRIETIGPPLKARPIWPLAALAATLVLSLTPFGHAVLGVQGGDAANGLKERQLVLSVASGLAKITGSDVASNR